LGNESLLPEQTTDKQQPFVQEQKKQAQILAESVNNSGFGMKEASM
jgi:hypothetical protein